MKLLLLLFMATFSIFTNKPAKDTQVFVENVKDREVVAFQTVGEKGRAAFDYLKEGEYRLSIVFPQQEGKYIKTKSKNTTLTKASYNEKNKTYYYQGEEGFFSVKFSGVKKIDSEEFDAVFFEEKSPTEKEARIVIARFSTRKSGASFEISVKALTAKQYKTATDKLGNDISTISIPNFK